MPRTAHASVLIAVVSIVAACGSKGSNGSGSASAEADASCKGAVSVFAKEFAPLVVENSTNPKKDEMQKAIEASIVDSCQRDAWDESVLKCFAKMPSGRRDICTDLLPKDKKDKYEQAVKDAQKKVLGITDEPSATASAGAGGAAPPALAKPVNLRGKAYALGERAGYAAVRRTLTGPTPAIDAAFADAQALAKDLGVELAPLPELKADKAENGAAALDYVLDKTDKALGPKIEGKAGKDGAALFELGLKAQVLRMMYIGDKKDDLVDAITGGMKGNLGLGRLPADLGKPVFDKIDALADPDAVEAALDGVDVAISQTLAGEGPG